MAVTQSHYRFGINELAESTHGWHANEDTSPTAGTGKTIDFDTTFLLRFTMQCDGTAQSNIDPEFQYRKNGGTWTQISTTSNDVRAVTTTVFTNGQNTTKRLSGTGTFESSSAGCTHDGIAGGAAFDIVASGNGETECSMQLRSADLVGGDLIEFRLTRDGGVLMDTYAVTPSFTISAAITRTAGAPVVTFTAPSAVRVATRTALATSPVVNFSAPAATIVVPGGGQTLIATAPLVTFSAPPATRQATRTLTGGAPQVLFTAPTATRVAGGVSRLAGAPIVTFSAPIATLQIAGGGGYSEPLMRRHRRYRYQ